MQIISKQYQKLHPHESIMRTNNRTTHSETSIKINFLPAKVSPLKVTNKMFQRVQYSIRVNKGH